MSAEPNYRVANTVRLVPRDPGRAGRWDIRATVEDSDGNSYTVIVQAELYTPELAIALARQQARLRAMERLNTLLRGGL